VFEGRYINVAIVSRPIKEHRQPQVLLAISDRPRAHFWPLHQLTCHAIGGSYGLYAIWLNA